jgi:hypothetical protein
VATSSTVQTRLLVRQPRALDAPAPLRLWHLTSLDAPTVAFIWTLAFAAAANVHLGLRIPLAIALAAWSLYIGDRILDCSRANATPQSLASLRERHHFHWRHRRLLVPIALGCAATALALFVRTMPSIPLAARERNTVLAAATAAYFTSVHTRLRVRLGRFKFPKELLVGILFTLACTAPTWTRSTINQFYLLPPILCFIALAWLNCHAIESWESQPNAYCRSRVFSSALIVAALATTAAILSLALGQHAFAALLIAASLSAALLALLDRIKSHLTPIALRAAADLVLLTPAVLLALKLIPASL